MPKGNNKTPRQDPPQRDSPRRDPSSGQSPSSDRRARDRTPPSTYVREEWEDQFLNRDTPPAPSRAPSPAGRQPRVSHTPRPPLYGVLIPQRPSSRPADQEVDRKRRTRRQTQRRAKRDMPPVSPEELQKRENTRKKAEATRKWKEDPRADGVPPEEIKKLHKLHTLVEHNKRAMDNRRRERENRSVNQQDLRPTNLPSADSEEDDSREEPPRASTLQRGRTDRSRSYSEDDHVEERPRLQAGLPRARPFFYPQRGQWQADPSQPPGGSNTEEAEVDLDGWSGLGPQPPSLRNSQRPRPSRRTDSQTRRDRES